MVRRIACIATAAVLFAPACKHKRHADRVAELAQGSGPVEANRSGQSAWTPAVKGHTFRVGDAVRTGDGAHARVRLFPAGGLVLGPDSQVRFGHGRRRIGLEVGTAEVEAGTDKLAIHTDIGSATVEASSRVRVSVRGGVLRFHVLVGKAQIEDDSGKSKKLSAGDSFGGKPKQPPKPKSRPAPPDAAPAPAVTAVRAKVRRGRVRVRSSGHGRWRRVRGTISLRPGARVRVPRGSEVDVSRGDERAIVRGRSEFVVGAAGEPLLASKGGDTTLVASKTDVTLRVPGGVIVARRQAGGGKSRAQVDVHRNRDATVTAAAGDVAIEAGGKQERLLAGDRADLARHGHIDVVTRPPRRADFSIPAGESPVVHAPRPPVAIRIRFGAACHGRGVVELSDRHGRFGRPSVVDHGATAGIVRVPAGTRHYRVRCLEDGAMQKPVRAGRIRVRHDAGTHPLPKRAALTIVDADGRHYTVLYQNLLPRLTFRWRKATSRDLELHLVAKGKARKRVIPASRGQLTLASGAVKEGSYEWWFQDPSDPEVRSPRTALLIRFDNTARTAYVQEPQVHERWRRRSVHVAGAALRGWRVSAAGRRLRLDADGRFSGTVSLPRGDAALAIRFSHPGRGVHYYLRRPGGKR